MANTILRLPAVKARTGLSRSTIYLLISRDLFPHQISLGARAVGWLESEIDTWLASKIAFSRDEEVERSFLPNPASHSGERQGQLK